MKYTTINDNDMINGEGVSVSLWMQGCPHRCLGCHNPELWEFDGGTEENVKKVLKKIYNAIIKNNIQRNFSVLGGEPLCPQNIFFTNYIIQKVKKKFPNIKIFIWTGYTLQELQEKYSSLNILLKSVDVLITGRYIQELRDVTLKWRGSSNQEILYKGIDF